ncbi:Alpha/beta hydrolase family protein [Shimia sp. SK013]|uniref:alpha/beta fold hydrolase n=1 Tax=Shimia sp. SK013 TaxID=1389006 RepID=UPI0006B650C2|nr:alpha/beta fold hydrolase [Shimia sp. SK013]KPA20748.1 Alpha/beta hydrolase family protein [Shimia sp. SK013]
MTDGDVSETNQQRPSLPEQTWDAAIERLYDVALDPTRYEALLDLWEDAMGPLRSEADFAAPHLMDNQVITSHFQRASRFLDLVESSGAHDELDQILRPFNRVPAFLVDGTLRVRAANTAARGTFGIVEQASLSQLNVMDAEASVLCNAVAGLLSGKGEPTAILRIPAQEERKFLILRLQRCQTSEGTPMVLAAANELFFPEDGKEILRDAFGLTRAEADVLCGLVECGSLAEIGARRGRSVDTIRSQIKAIMSKTETQSQVDLVRLALSVVDMASPALSASGSSQPPSGGGASLEPQEFKTLARPDGRRLDYLILGASQGPAVLYLPLTYGLTRWPASAEAEARKRGWRIIVPIRAGYGFSDPLPRSENYDLAMLGDVVAILDAEGVRRCPLLTLAAESYYAVQFARHFPDRFTALVCTAGALPLRDREAYERMDKWHRFILAGAKYTPHLLPFMVKSGFFLARRIGKHGFLNAVYGASEADVATFEIPEVFEALAVGSQVSLSKEHSAHEAFSRILTGGMFGDWRADLEALRGQIPITFLNGLQDPMVPPETLDEFQRDYDWIDFRIYEDAGQLLFFRHWMDGIEALAPFVWE